MKLRKFLFPVSLLSTTAAAVGQSADLKVYHSPDKPTPLVDTNVVFTVVVNNDGVDDATGVTVANLLPSGYQFLSAAPDAGSYDPVTGVWTIGSLLNGQSYYMYVTAKVLSAGNYQNVATISGNEADPSATNNTWTTTTTPSLNLYWDGTSANIDAGTIPPDGASAGGDGTWNGSIKNWDVPGEASYFNWDNSKGYTANIRGTIGTVTLGSNISAGKLAISVTYPPAPAPPASPYPTIISTIALGSNTLTLTGADTTISGNNTVNITGTGSILLGSSQSWANSANTMTISAPVNTGANLLTLETGSNNLDVTGKISGSGGLTVKSSVGSGTTASNGTIIANGPVNPTLNNSNDYTGTTTVNGWIWLNSGGVSALGADTSDLIFNNGGVRLTNPPASPATITRGIVLTGNSGISKISGDTTVNGVISGSGNLVISGNFNANAAVVLAASNTFTGNCTSGPDGLVRLANVNAIPNSNMRWADNNGRSKFDLATNNLAYVIGGLGNAALSNVNNVLDLGSGLAGGGNGLVSFGANNQSNTYVGIISGAAGFKKIGTGTQTLIGANTYTGSTVVAAGTLKLGKISGQTGVSVTTGTSGTNVARLTVPSATNLYNGQAVSGALIAAGVKITQINSATQVSLSVNPATPATATTVDFADMLGSMPASPVIDVQTGATLDVTTYPWTLLDTQTLKGAGTVTGAITVAGAVAPGSNAIGTLTTGDVTFAATGTYACELSGATSDCLAAGALTIDPAAKITFTGTPTASSYVIATYTGAAPTHFATDASLPAGYSVDYGTAGQIKLVGSGGASPFVNWASTKGLSGQDAEATADPDHDGLSNVIEFVVGGEPNPANPNSNSSDKLPTAEMTPTHMVFSFRRTDECMTQPGITVGAEYGSTLAGWTTAQHNSNNVTIQVTENGYGTGVDRVDVSLPKSLAGSTGRLFARLSASF